MAKGKNILEETKDTNKIEETLHEIPKHWTWAKFGSVCKLYNGYAFKSKDYGEEGIPLVRISNIDNFKVIFSEDNTVYIDESQLNEKFIVKSGDLLIAMSGATTGKTGVYSLKDTALQNQRVGNIKVIDEELIDEKFRNYFIAYKSREILDLAYGGAQPNISAAIIEGLDIALPPIEEQRRISKIIENLFEKLHKTKEILEEAREGIEKRRAAILYKAFSGELIDFKEAREIVLKDCIAFVSEKWEPGEAEEVKYLGLENFESGKGIASVGSSKGLKSAKNVFKEGDVLYGRLRPYLNKHDIAKFSGICSTDILVIRAKEEVLPEYINYYFDTIEFIDYAVGNSNGINLPRVSAKTIGDKIIKLPSLETQRRLVDTLHSIFALETRAEEIINLENQIELIKSSILSKAFRGDLSSLY